MSSRRTKPRTSPWTFTGDGRTTTFPLPGRTSTDARDYSVTVGGMPQLPDAFTLPKGEAHIVFSEAPPAGLPIIIYVRAVQ